MPTEQVFSAFNDLLASFIRSIPATVAALFLLLVGWLLGKFIGKLTKKVLKNIKIDNYFKLGGGIKISEISSLLVSWVIYLAFIQASIQSFGITSLSLFFDKILTLVTGIFGGLVILTISYFIARYIEKQILLIKSEYSTLFAQFVFIFVMVIAVSIAFEIVGIPTDLINNIIIVLVASVGLGIAIALGLGLKDSVARLARKYEKRG